MKRKLIFPLLCCLLALLPPYLHAQPATDFNSRPCELTPSSKNFRYLTVNDGFARSAVLDILQTSKGTMWFATWDGLYSFDGYKLKRACRPMVPTLDNSYVVVVGITEVTDHEIWMRTNRGVYIWDDKYQQLKNLKLSGIQQENRQYIAFLEKDHHGKVWFANINGDIYTYDSPTRQVKKVYQTQPSDSCKLNFLYIDDQDNKWICSPNNGIFKLDTAGGKGRTQLSRDGQFKHFEQQTVLALFKDAQDCFWVGTPNGIYRMGRGNQLKDGVSDKFEIPQLLSQQEIKIQCFAESGSKVYAATTQGLFCYDKQQDKAEWMVTGKPGKGLNDMNIRSVAVDKEGGLWLATFNGGVNYLSPTAENFCSFAYINERIKGHVVSGIAEDRHHNLWLSTEDGGLNYWNRSTDEVQHFGSGSAQGIAPTVNNVQSIYVDNDLLYVGMFGGGMDVIDLKTQTKKNFQRKNTGPSQLPNSVYGFHRLNDSQMLIATIEGLYLYDRPTEKFNKVPPTSAKINCIAEDEQKEIWVGSENGIFHLSPQLVLLEHLRYEPGDSTSLCTNHITTLTPFGSLLYIGTNEQGLWSMNKSTRQLKCISGNHLKEATIYKLIVDKDNLWISTNRGLYCQNTISRQIRTYTVEDGIGYNQFKSNSGLMTADHTLFFGSVYGFTGFKPQLLVYNDTRPEVMLTDLYLFNKPIVLTDEDSPLDRSINYASSIQLHQRLNNFTFKFASSSYSQLERNEFEYRLEPFEHEWQRTADGFNAASYTNLPVGKYTLHVRTSNGNNVWSEERCLDVEITPFWWLSVPMKLLYLLLCCGGAGWAIYRYIRRKRKEIYLLHLEKEQELYHSKMDFFTFMIHEIRTPLTLILGPVADIMERKCSIEDVRPELTTIRNNGNRLLSLVNQLMDFRKVEEKSYLVQPTDIELKDVIVQVVQDFQYKCSQKGITLTTALPEGPCLAKADREAIRKVVTNLLSNATKFANDRIDVSVQENSETKMWEIGVRDNGKGIDKAYHDKIFSSFYQVRKDLPSDYIGTGVGLSVVKHLLELQEGNIRVESQVGAGAYFIASIPQVLTEATAITGQEESAQTARSNGNYRLLVAEDNAEMRQYIATIFAGRYQVDACCDGKEALAMTRKNGYDLILTDWMMPEIDGLTLAKTLKGQDETSHIPIVMLTAKDDEQSQVDAFTSHADAYVMKPFSSKVLLSQVEAIIRNREHLHREYLKQPEATEDILCQNDLDKKFIEKLNTLIDERIMNTSISVDELATNLCLGRTTFYQKVKAIAGVTPNEYVSTYKLKKAAKMLKTGDIRVNEICYMIGFSSSSYFAKKFTAQFGMSPTEYIKNAE